jgi:hypothetical protein
LSPNCDSIICHKGKRDELGVNGKEGKKKWVKNTAYAEILRFRPTCAEIAGWEEVVAEAAGLQLELVPV